MVVRTGEGVSSLSCPDRVSPDRLHVLQQLCASTRHLLTQQRVGVCACDLVPLCVRARVRARVRVRLCARVCACVRVSVSVGVVKQARQHWGDIIPPHLGNRTVRVREIRQ